MRPWIEKDCIGGLVLAWHRAKRFDIAGEFGSGEMFGNLCLDLKATPARIRKEFTNLNLP